MAAIIPERYGRGALRALVLSDMRPDRAHPERGSFVRDQVRALDALGGAEVQLVEFPPGPRALLRAASMLWESHRRTGFDVVHAHFGLTAWPALSVPAKVRALTIHGSDVRVRRTRVATAAVLGTVDLLAVASPALIEELPGAKARARAEVLPCGVDLERFEPLERTQARRLLDLPADEPLLLFAADPARPEKRHDRALALSQAAGARLLTLGGVAPERVPLLVNAVNAVLVTSEREGFGLAVLEALACDVPVLATPVGIHPEALAGVAGTLCEEFALEPWLAALRPHLEQEQRIRGRAAAERYGSHAMAAKVLDAWQRALAR